MKTNEEKNPFRYLPVQLTYDEACRAAARVTNNPDAYIPGAVADAKHDLELLQCLTQAQEGRKAVDWKDCAEYGWTIIANAGGGNWEKETKDWQEAAARFRDQYHACLSAARHLPATQGHLPEGGDKDLEALRLCERARGETSAALHNVAMYALDLTLTVLTTDGLTSDLKNRAYVAHRQLLQYRRQYDLRSRGEVQRGERDPAIDAPNHRAYPTSEQLVANADALAEYYRTDPDVKAWLGDLSPRTPEVQS